MHGDKELRSKVTLISSVLGEILKKQSNETVFGVVEELRTGHIELRKEHNLSVESNFNIAQSGFTGSCPADTIKTLS